MLSKCGGATLVERPAPHGRSISGAEPFRPDCEHLSQYFGNHLLGLAHTDSAKQLVESYFTNKTCQPCVDERAPPTAGFSAPCVRLQRLFLATASRRRQVQVPTGVSPANTRRPTPSLLAVAYLETITTLSCRRCAVQSLAGAIRKLV